MMWATFFGGGNGVPRAQVDPVVRVIDRYLSEEAKLCMLQSEKQTVDPWGPPPDKLRARQVAAIRGWRRIATGFRVVPDACEPT
jgi:hypothetical protein